MITRRPAIIALILGLAVHGGLLYAFKHYRGDVDIWAFRSLDCHEYYDLGKNILHNHVFSQDTAAPFAPETWRVPGYPAFLAGVMWMFDDTARSCVLMQHWLAVLNVLLFIGAAEPFLGGRRALLGSLILLVVPYQLYYSFWLVSGILFTTGLLLVWMSWNSAQHHGSLWRFAWCGLLAGGIILIRPIGLLVPLALVIAILFARGQRARGVRALALVIMAAVAPGLWMLRNQQQAGHAALSSQSGTVLAYFKAAEVALWARGEADERYIQTSLSPKWGDIERPVWNDIDEKLQARFEGQEDAGALRWQNLAQGNTTRFDDFEVSAGLRAIGRDILLDHWAAALACSAVRCGSILTFPLNRVLTEYAGTTPEAPDSARTEKLQSWALGGVYTLLCAIVLVQLLRCRTKLAGGLFPIMVTAALLIATVPQIDPRFRIPMMPFLVFLMLARKTQPQDGTDAEQDAVADNHEPEERAQA
jgi:hypothetical protein